MVQKYRHDEFGRILPQLPVALVPGGRKRTRAIDMGQREARELFYGMTWTMEKPPIDRRERPQKKRSSCV